MAFVETLKIVIGVDGLASTADDVKAITAVYPACGHKQALHDKPIPTLAHGELNLALAPHPRRLALGGHSDRRSHLRNIAEVHHPVLQLALGKP